MPRRAAAPRFDAVAFVERHGIVLAAGKGPVPSVAEAVAGESIRGSWWAHPKGRAIFAALAAIADAPDVLAFRLVAGKVTYAHRRLWAALVRLAASLGTERLTAIRQEHTASGAHRNVTTAFPEWVPRDVREAAARMSEDQARAMLGTLATWA